ncbi:guanine nucleotide-binding protein G(i) subunit alpha-3-like [Glandiceps talaboti]
MGSGVSTKHTNREESHRIDGLIQQEKEKAKRTAKILLLGDSGAGKSTFVKQMKMLHKDGFNEADRLVYKHIIQGNVVEFLDTILTAMKKLGISFSDIARKVDEDVFFQYFTPVYQDTMELPYQVAKAASRLWQDEGVQQCYLRSREYQFAESANHFLDKVEQLSEPDYMPTDTDILYARTTTSGIVETQFEIEGIFLNIVDVGGQKTERRKWIHCFEDCTSLIFLVALSCYDLILFEDEGQNKMHDSLQLFRSTCNNHWLRSVSVILFLNKMDIFRKKLRRSPLNLCFPEYAGTNCVRETAMYLKSKFELLNERREHRPMYTHFTVATDSKNIESVFKDIMYQVLMTNLYSCQLV